MTGITGTLFLLSLFLKGLRQQGSLESSGAALVIAFLLGQFVPALDNGYAMVISILPAKSALCGVLSSPVCIYRCCCSIDHFAAKRSYNCLAGLHASAFAVRNNEMLPMLQCLTLCRIHAGGLIGGLAVGIIILIQYGIRGLLGGRKARGAKA